MSFIPFSDSEPPSVGDRVHTVTYNAHTQAEFDEICRALVNMMSKPLDRAVSQKPTNLLLGPCIAFVNVFVLELQIDHKTRSIFIKFREARYSKDLIC